MSKNLGCINPHGYYPFPVSRDVCPECQAIRALAPVFTPRHGLRYRWWRDIPCDIIVTTIVIVLLLGMLVFILGAWVFDWKGWW